METTVQKKRGGGLFPLDLAVLLARGLSPFLVSLPLMSLLCNHGGTSLMVVALILGFIGIILLFWAQLPLYRQHRFLVFGAQSLNAAHKKLYYTAYVFIVVSVLLLLSLILA